MDLCSHVVDWKSSCTAVIIYLLSVWDQYFSIDAICVSKVIFLNGMDGRFLLSKDQCQTSSIEEVTTANTF